MFYNFSYLKSIDFSSFNTSNVNGMLCSVLVLPRINRLSSLYTSNVNNMSYILSYCSSLKSIDSSFNKSNINKFNLDNIFYGCKSLKKKILK